MVDAPQSEPGAGADADGPEEAVHRDAVDRTAAAAPLPMSQIVGRVVLGVIAVLFIVFAIINRQPVDFSWVFGATEVVEQGGEYVRGGVPLIILLIGSFVLGSIVSTGLLWRRRRVRRRRQEDGRTRAS
jgi:uncharacterized integral membrane protein